MFCCSVVFTLSVGGLVVGQLFAIQIINNTGSDFNMLEETFKVIRQLFMPWDSFCAVKEARQIEWQKDW